MAQGDSGDIIAHVMTGQDVADASQVEPLLGRIDMPVAPFTAEGAEPMTANRP